MLGALSASTEKRTEFNMSCLPPGREIRFVPDKYLSQIDVAGEVPAIAIGAAIKLSHFDGHGMLPLSPSLLTHQGRSRRLAKLLLPRPDGTVNLPFGEWGKIFPDHAMTLATIDRLVHHATILEMNVESYRRRTALQRKRGKTAQPS